MESLAKFFSRGKRLFRNASLDLKYGAFLGGIRRTRYAHLGVHDTANTDYEALPLIFKDAIQKSDVLVDIGCGKGRVINWWLDSGLRNPMIGIELDKLVADDTRRRLRGHANVQIICGDVLEHLPQTGTIFYLFNPFDKRWVVALKDGLSKLFAQADKKVIYYYNCVHVEVFETDPEWSVEKRALDGSHFHPLAVITRRR